MQFVPEGKRSRYSCELQWGRDRLEDAVLSEFLFLEPKPQPQRLEV